MPLPANVRDLSRWLGTLDEDRKKKDVRLNIKRKQVLLLHLAGVPAKEICEQVRCSPTYVYQTVNSDQGQQVFEDFIRYNDSEFRALRGLAIQAVRDALKPEQDIETRLRAADKVFKSQGDYGQKEDKTSLTAEDIIRRVFEYQDGDRKVRVEESRPAKQVETQAKLPLET